MLLLGLWCLALWGCDRPAGKAEPDPARGGIQITDDQGHKVSLSGPARRIASLSPANTESLFAMGCGEAIVLRDTVSTFPAATRKIPATNPFNISPEHVAGFSPDLVLLSHADPLRLAALRRLKLQVAVFEPRTLQQLYQNIRSIGRLCGATDQARDLVAQMQRRVEAVAERVWGRPRPMIYIETDGSDPLKPWTCSSRSFVGHMVRLAGGENLIRGKEKRYLQINAEEVLTGRPDYILMMAVAKGVRGRGVKLLRARPGWDQLPAVRQGKIIDEIHADLISRPGPRLMQGLELLARAIHPGAFP